MREPAILKPVSLLFAASLSISAAKAADAAWHLVDAPHESPGHLGYAEGDGVVVSEPERANLEALDFVDRRAGDFSLKGVVEKKPTSVGLTPGAFIASWDLGFHDRLKLWVRLSGSERLDAVEFVLVDASGRRARHPSLQVTPDGAWQHVDAPFDAFDLDAGFDLGAVVALQTAAALPVGTHYAFDGAYFEALDPDRQPLGITDMTYDQRMAEAEHTRHARAVESYRTIADFSDRKNPGSLYGKYAKLWLGEDLDRINAELLAIFTAEPGSELSLRYSVHRDWSLLLTPWMVRTYEQFGSTSKRMPGRLYPETERALLELLWRRTQAINDISLARRSTWWMTGSENHDIHTKVDSLLSSQIFKKHPDFKDRVYLNEGRGAGTGYWFHHQHGDSLYKGPSGKANWSDGKDHTPVDHYEAWSAYWKEYLRERVKKGFFLEVASQGYMKFTVGSLLDLADHAEDEELRELAGEFLDLVWAEWAQDQLVAVRGGSKTRWYDRPYGAMFRAAGHYMGNLSGDTHFWYRLFTSEYRWPEHIWRMALDRQAKGDFAYISRKPGEEPLLDGPRPAGLERSLMCDTESRFVRYSWVTPDYILGTQMDHPNAIHSHLSTQNRWQGMTFSASHTTTIAPCGINDENPDNWKQASREKTAYFRSLQDENILITQQARRWHQQNPDWFPAKTMHDLPFGVRFNKSFDLIEEEGGWVFAKVGNAYAGVRPVKGDYDYDSNWTSAGESQLHARMAAKTYEWGPNRQFIRFLDNFSPVILHAGRAETHGDFESFKQHVLAGQVILLNTVVPGWYILVYEPKGEKPRRFEFNAANHAYPSLNGKLVDYAPAKVLRSPFLDAEYGSGVVHYTADGVELKVDFN